MFTRCSFRVSKLLFTLFTHTLRFQAAVHFFRSLFTLCSQAAVHFVHPIFSLLTYCSLCSPTIHFVNSLFTLCSEAAVHSLFACSLTVHFVFPGCCSLCSLTVHFVNSLFTLITHCSLCVTMLLFTLFTHCSLCVPRLLFTPCSDCSGSYELRLLLVEQAVAGIPPNTASATVTVTVTAVNDPPTAFAFHNGTDLVPADPAADIVVRCCRRRCPTCMAL